MRGGKRGRDSGIERDRNLMIQRKIVERERQKMFKKNINLPKL